MLQIHLECRWYTFPGNINYLELVCYHKWDQNVLFLDYINYNEVPITH